MIAVARLLGRQATKGTTGQKGRSHFFVSLIDDTSLCRIQTYLHTPEIKVRDLGWRAQRGEEGKNTSR